MLRGILSAGAMELKGLYRRKWTSEHFVDADASINRATGVLTVKKKDWYGLYDVETEPTKSGWNINARNEFPTAVFALQKGDVARLIYLLRVEQIISINDEVDIVDDTKYGQRVIEVEDSQPLYVLSAFSMSRQLTGLDFHQLLKGDIIHVEPPMYMNRGGIRPMDGFKLKLLSPENVGQISAELQVLCDELLATGAITES